MRNLNLGCDFLFETLNLARKILNRPIAMAAYRSTFFSLRVVISVVVAAFGRLLLRSQLKVQMLNDRLLS